MTVKRYLADPATLSGTVTVTAIISGERPAVRLRETWFHPQGGGQKADRGTIGSVNVTYVAHNAGEVDHFVDDASALEVGKSYPFSIDAAARRLNAAYHTAGHLVAGVMENKFPGLRALAGHQWPGEARVEFEGDHDDHAHLQKVLEQEILRNIESRTPVAIIGDPYADRAIRIGEYAAIPCGGTHVSDISEIGGVCIDAVKKKSGKIRVSYTVATNRAA